MKEDERTKKGYFIAFLSGFLSLLCFVWMALKVIQILAQLIKV